MYLFFFFYALLSCKPLEDGANSGPANPEATKSSDEQVSDAQPANDLALRVER